MLKFLKLIKNLFCKKQNIFVQIIPSQKGAAFLSDRCESAKTRPSYSQDRQKEFKEMFYPIIAMQEKTDQNISKLCMGRF